MGLSDKLVDGVGINDADYKIMPTVNGKHVMCPFYRVWSNMIVRCYNKKYQEKYPTYNGCSVCEEWLTFSRFKRWMEVQDWKGKHLDKDVLDSGNKEYSSTRCVFISGRLNMLLTDRAAKRGDFPLGVYWKKQNSKFSSQIRDNGKNKHLGYFLTTQSAHAAWQIAKRDIISNTALEQTDIRLKYALLLRCDQLQHDINNGLETIKL